MFPNDAGQLYTRKALSQSLQGIWQHPLTVVQAPMGYGKTTAVREFMTHCRAKVLWQTVFDSSADAFWSGFSHLLGRLDPVCDRNLAALGVPGDSLLREEVVELLGAVQFPAPTVIVIDDYQLLSSVDLKKKLFTVRFAELRDEAAFRAAATDGKPVCWPGGLSLDLGEIMELAKK